MSMRVIGTVLVCAVLAGCATSKSTDQKIAESSAITNQKIQSLAGQLEEANSRNQALEAKSAQLEQQVNLLAQIANDALKRTQEAGVLVKGKMVYEQAFTSHDIPFGNASAALDGAAQRLLDDFAAQLKAVEDSYFLEIQGHTASDEPNGNALSEQRAAAVRRYLNRAGIPLQRMSTIGYGDSSPLASNKTAAGRAQNRRALVLVLDAGDISPITVAQYPQFPWPPPAASGIEVLPNNFVAPAAGAKLSDVKARLEHALESSGYPQGKYYAVPGGFALVARLEHIKSDGSPLPGNDRFLPIDVRPDEDFTFWSYLRAIVSARPGYYRVIVFVVTPLSFAPTEIAMSETEAKQKLSGGLNDLPPEIGRITFAPARYKCTALVYEFERPTEDDPARLLVPGKIAKTHLQKAGVWTALERSGR